MSVNSRNKDKELKKKAFKPGTKSSPNNIKAGQVCLFLRMKKRKTERSFRGWDWTEISSWLGVDVDYNKPEKEILDKTREKIKEIMDLFNTNRISKHQQKLIDGIRTFTLRLSEHNNSYSSPLWSGLYKIEHDGEFLKFVYILLERMWD